MFVCTTVLEIRFYVCFHFCLNTMKKKTLIYKFYLVLYPISLTKRVRGLLPLRLANSSLKSPTSSFVLTNQVRASLVLFLGKKMGVNWFSNQSFQICFTYFLIVIFTVVHPFHNLYCRSYIRVYSITIIGRDATLEFISLRTAVFKVF